MVLLCKFIDMNAWFALLATRTLCDLSRTDPLNAKRHELG